MADRTDQDSGLPSSASLQVGEPFEEQVATRMRQACAHLVASRGPGFAPDPNGQLRVGALSVELRHLSEGPAPASGAPCAAFMCVLPEGKWHVSRHALALQLNAHALVVHGASLTAVGDGTLVLMQPIDLRLHDTIALAAALVRFVQLASFMADELGLGPGGTA